MMSCFGTIVVCEGFRLGDIVGSGGDGLRGCGWILGLCSIWSRISIFIGIRCYLILALLMRIFMSFDLIHNPQTCTAIDYQQYKTQYRTNDQQ